MDDDDIVHVVLDKLDGVRGQHGYWMARCPAHEDGTASLQVARGKDQPVVLICHANCTTEDVLGALGMTYADISAQREERPDAGEWTPHGRASAVYVYTDEDGKTLFEVLRVAAQGGKKKQFPARVPDPSAKSGYRWRLGATRRVLYRLPQLRPAIEAGMFVYVVEGEKDVHSVERVGGVATCNPGGAGGWRKEYAEVLRDAYVIIVADADKPGREHAHAVAASLVGVAASVEVKEAAEGKDVTDHLGSGRTLADLVVTSGGDEAMPELALDLLAFIAEPDPEVRFVLPGLLERGDRLVWTGPEGLGKTTVTRQIGVAAAAGVNPFNPVEHIKPQMVLFLDCENRLARSRRKFRDLVGRCNRFRQLQPGMFRIVHRPDGINLLDPEGAAFVLERVTAYRPDLLVIGPLYKLHAMDANEEMAARAIVRTLDQALEICNSALIVEAHSPHGVPRTLRPRGSSLFMAWPDYGYGIREYGDSPDAMRVQVREWRGPREMNDWPGELVWGTWSELPWVVPAKPGGNPAADLAAGEGRD